MATLLLRFFAVTAIIVLVAALNRPVKPDGAAIQSPAIREWNEAKIDVVLRALKTSGSIIIDTRDAASYLKGHIPHAINLTDIKNMSQVSLSNESLRTAPMVVVYDRSARYASGKLLAINLKKQTDRQVELYEGGWSEWQQFGQKEEVGE